MRTVDLGWVNISHVISIASGLNFTIFLLFNAGLTVLDNAIYRLSISLSSPEIVAVKLETCCKNVLNFGRSLPSQILSGRSRDIRDQTLKSSEIGPNFACFGP